MRTPTLPLPSEAEEGTEDRLEVKGQEVKPKLPNRVVEKARWGLPPGCRSTFVVGLGGGLLLPPRGHGHERGPLTVVVLDVRSQLPEVGALDLHHVPHLAGLAGVDRARPSVSSVSTWPLTVPSYLQSQSLAEQMNVPTYFFF